MQDFRLEEGPPLRSTRKLGNLSGSKPKFHSHSEVYQRITRASVRRDNGCIEWLGCLVDGYGMITFRGVSSKVHRLVYRIVFGKLEADICVLHKCDNRKCVNPDHLFTGTKKDNSEDCVKKGRTARGHMIGASKLTEDQALEIKTLASIGNLTRKEIAYKFGVSSRTVQAIYSGEWWKYLKTPSPSKG